MNKKLFTRRCFLQSFADDSLWVGLPQGNHRNRVYLVLCSRRGSGNTPDQSTVQRSNKFHVSDDPLGKASSLSLGKRVKFAADRDMIGDHPRRKHVAPGENRERIQTADFTPLSKTGSDDLASSVRHVMCLAYRYIDNNKAQLLSLVIKNYRSTLYLRPFTTTWHQLANVQVEKSSGNPEQ